MQQITIHGATIDGWVSILEDQFRKIDLENYRLTLYVLRDRPEALLGTARLHFVDAHVYIII